MKTAAEYARAQRARQWLAAARARTTCPIRTCRGVLETSTDHLGRLVIRCPRCERRLAGVCRDCPRPVDGEVGKATRCAPCRLQARRLAEALCAARHRERRQAMARKAYRTNAARRERRRAYSQAWRARNPDKVARYKRREALKQSPERLAYFRAQNARRAEAKRAHARAAYYRQHPERPRPVCRTCGADIPWAPPGRPPVLCGDCVPASVAKRRRQELPTPAPIAVVPPAGHPCRGWCGRTLHGHAKKCESCKVTHLRRVLRAREVAA